MRRKHPLKRKWLPWVITVMTKQRKHAFTMSLMLAVDQIESDRHVLFKEHHSQIPWEPMTYFRSSRTSSIHDLLQRNTPLSALWQNRLTMVQSPWKIQGNSRIQSNGWYMLLYTRQGTDSIGEAALQWMNQSINDKTWLWLVGLFETCQNSCMHSVIDIVT